MLVLIAALAMAQGAGPVVTLRCEGVSYDQATDTITAPVAPGQTVRSGSVSRTVEVPGVAIVELAGTAGRIRPPRGYAPLMSTGGSDGWWAFTEVSSTDGRVRARYTYNVVDKPKVTIDRLTGEIRIQSLSGQFNGRCAVAEPEKRLF